MKIEQQADFCMSNMRIAFDKLTRARENMTEVYVEAREFGSASPEFQIAIEAIQAATSEVQNAFSKVELAASQAYQIADTQ